jgi:hypothetical protein
MTQYLLSVWHSEKNPVPTDPAVMQKAFKQVDELNAELQAKGLWVFGGGLHEPSSATVVTATDGDPVMTDGPFAETKELLAGFWVFNVGSLQEAIDWVKKAPMDEGTELEIRQIFTADDFGDALTPELREQEERLRAETTAH